MVMYHLCYSNDSNVYDWKFVSVIHFCHQKARTACAQSFTLWQQATIEFTWRNHSIIGYSNHIYMGVVLCAHSVCGELRIQRNASGVVATICYSIIMSWDYFIHVCHGLPLFAFFDFGVYQLDNIYITETLMLNHTHNNHLHNTEGVLLALPMFFLHLMYSLCNFFHFLYFPVFF